MPFRAAMLRQVKLRSLPSSIKWSENGSERTTANEQLAHANERFAKEARVFADAYDQLSGASNAEGQGWKLTNSAPLIVPHSIAGSMYRSEDVHTAESFLMATMRSML